MKKPQVLSRGVLYSLLEAVAGKLGLRPTVLPQASTYVWIDPLFAIYLMKMTLLFLFVVVVE